MKKIISLLIVSGLIFPAKIQFYDTYTQISNNEKESFWGNPVVNKPKKPYTPKIITLNDIKIFNTYDNHVTFSHKKIVTRGIKLGGFFLALGASVSIINKWREFPDYNEYSSMIEYENAVERYNEISEILVDIGLFSYLLSGISFWNSDVKNREEIYKIPCSDVIQIIDDKNRLIKFDCAIN